MAHTTVGQVSWLEIRSIEMVHKGLRIEWQDAHTKTKHGIRVSPINGDLSPFTRDMLLRLAREVATGETVNLTIDREEL